MQGDQLGAKLRAIAVSKHEVGGGVPDLGKALVVLSSGLILDAFSCNLDYKIRKFS